jgi:hypothetical protein
MCPVRIPHATATTTTAGETYVSIVRPMNAHTWARCGSPLLRLFPAYMILGTARSEAKTRWTAQSAEVEPPKSPAISIPRPSCGVRLMFVALRFASPTSRRRRGTPSGSVTRFTPLPAVGLVAPTRVEARCRIVNERLSFSGVTRVTGVATFVTVAMPKP